jgi:chromosome segregation ATPase
MLNANIWLAIGVIVGGFLLVRLWRKAEDRVVRLEEEAETLTTDGMQLAASLSKEAQARKRLSDELASLRNKADKAKRRQAKTVDRPLGTTARIRDHESQIERIELERDKARSEREALAHEAARLEIQLAASQRALEEASAPRPKPIASEVEKTLERVNSELASSRERVGKLNEELELVRQSESRMRKRMNNQEQLYASLRAELDVKKDRLRTQEEQLQRLQALKVAVID